MARNSKILQTDLQPNEQAQVWCVIPTLNEAATIAEVVQGALPHCAQVLVIDGGSNDGTVEIAQNAGAHVEVFRKPGKGRALIRALEMVPVPITVFMDADGSHDPNDIPLLAAPVLRDQADMVIGCRWTGGSDELHGDMNKWLRRAGSRVLMTLVNARYGVRLTDMQNGFRAVQTEIANKIGLREAGFTIEQEMMMKFLAGGFRAQNVPSHEYARRGGQAKLQLNRVWLQFGLVVLRHLFNLERPRLRRRYWLQKSKRTAKK